MSNPRRPTAQIKEGVYHAKHPPFSAKPINAPTSRMEFPTPSLLSTKGVAKPNPKTKAVKKALWGSSGKKITNDTKRPIVQNPAQVGDPGKWHAGISRVGTHVTKDNNVGMRDPDNHVWASRNQQEVLNLDPNLPGKRKNRSESKAKPAPKGKVLSPSYKPQAVTKPQPPAPKPTSAPIPRSTLPQGPTALPYVSKYGFLIKSTIQ